MDSLRQNEAVPRPQTVENRLRHVIDTIPCLIISAKPDGSFDFVNRWWLEFTGFKLEEVQGWGWRVALHPEDAGRVLKDWRSGLASGEPFETEARVRGVDGEYRWFLLRNVPLRDEEGRIVQWYGTGHDTDDLKRATDRLQLAIDTTPALIHTGRPDGYLDYFNHRWLEYLGLSLEDICGWRWTNVIHPDDVDEMVKKWRSSLATGELFEAEARVRRADGEYRWQFHRKVPLRDQSGKIAKWYGSSIDIEERRRAEDGLRRSEFYFAEGQRLAHMGSWVFNPAGFDYWSRELFHIYGLNPAQEAPNLEEYLALIHPEDRGFMASLVKRVVEEASGFDVTKRIIRPNDEVRFVRCVGVPVVENGKLRRFVGTAIDVTEHELLTQELRQSETELRELIDAIPHQVFVFGADWSPLSANLREREYTGLSPEEARSKEAVAKVFHPEDFKKLQQARARALSDETSVEIEVRIRGKDGQYRWFLIRDNLLRDEQGRILRWYGTRTDIEDRKRAEEMVQRSEAYLSEAQRLSHTGSFGWKPDSGEIVWSDETYRIFEYDSTLKPTIDLLVQRVHPEDRPDFLKIIDRASQTGTNFEHEYRLLMADGRVKHVHGVAHVLQDPSGNREFVGAATDVTSIKRGEEELRTSEAYLAEAQRLTHMSSWVWEVEGRRALHLSDEWYRIYGFDPRQGMPGWEQRLQRVHPEDREKWQGTIERAIRERSGYEIEFRILLPDRTVKWVHTVGHSVLNVAGEVDRFVGSSMDVTERKEADAKIREQEVEFGQILDLAPQFVGVFGPAGERLYANRIGLDYIGRSLEEWRQTPGTFFQFCFHPDDRERAARTHSDNARSGGSAYELELRLRKRDGIYRWFLVRFNPLRDGQGQITRWYLALTDIEDRKQAEDRLLSENIALREEIDKTSMFEEIVGASPALKAVLSRVSKVAASDSTVLITGETGTGKELVARAIHRQSRRASRPFVAVNCAAIPRDLIASELFGHEKGAFTGATQQRLGRFELAAGGSIFLDEVGELPAETQVALLRVLQEHEFERVGGSRSIQTDVRVIAATNRDLQTAISTETFRSDLFYRLNVFPVEIPPLRERTEDIPLLVEYFIDRYARQAGKTILRIDKKTLDLLQSYPWPGNIRELQNVVERSVIVGETETFSIDPSWLSRQPRTVQPTTQLDLSRRLAQQEKEMIEAALRECGGRVFGASGAAARLGMPRSTLESKIRTLKINKNRFKTADSPS